MWPCTLLCDVVSKCYHYEQWVALLKGVFQILQMSAIGLGQNQHLVSYSLDAHCHRQNRQGKQPVQSAQILHLDTDFWMQTYVRKLKYLLKNNPLLDNRKKLVWLLSPNDAQCDWIMGQHTECLRSQTGQLQSVMTTQRQMVKRDTAELETNLKLSLPLDTAG